MILSWVAGVFSGPMPSCGTTAVVAATLLYRHDCRCRGGSTHAGETGPRQAGEVRSPVRNSWKLPVAVEMRVISGHAPIYP